MASDLYLDTPCSKAIRSFFQSMEQVIQEMTSKVPVKAYLFGGCALHIHTNARGSDDVDVHLESIQKMDWAEILLEIEATYFIDSDGELKTLEGDTGFNTAIASVAPDFQARSIPLNFGTYLVRPFLVSGLDLAVSKLGRGDGQDMEDILALYKSRKFTLEEFKVLAQEALDYSATPDSLNRNIAHAIRILEACDL